MDALDKFFKNKMDQRSVPFDEAHWQAAEQLLNDKDKRKRRVLLWWWIGGGTSVGIGLLLAAFLYWDFPNSSSAEYKEQITQLSNSQSEPSSEIFDEKNSSSAIKHTEVAKILEEESCLSINNSEKEVIIPNNLSKTTGEEESTSFNNKLEKQPSHEYTDERSNPLNAEQTVETIVVQIDNEQGEKVNNDNGLSDLPGEEGVTEAEAAEATIMVLAPFSPIPTLLKELSYSWEDDINKEDVVSEEVKIKRLRKMYWALSAATVLNPSEGKSILGGHMSVNTYKALSERTKIHMQLGYQWQNGTFGISQEVTQSVYGFGLSVQRYHLEPSRLHYLTGSLGLSRSFRKHELSAGVAYQYLLGLQGRLTNSEKTPFTFAFNKTETAATGWLEENGYRKHVFGATLAYQYRLVGPLDLMAQLYYWPSLLTDDTPELPDEVRLEEAGPIFIDVGVRIRLFD
ncbi:MAG: hypothetical protein MI974_17760 [Chitinophagales bacterium]|nr:hypothetical protein [Chitinophagales bacterium]